MSRQLHNTYKLESYIETKESEKQMAATEKCWTNQNFLDMKTDTSELYFSKKIPGSLEHISLLI